MPSTLRTELDRLGYDWDEGEMVAQQGSASQRPSNTRAVERNDPLLDAKWQNGPQADLPRFLAADARAIYVPFADTRGSGLRRYFHDMAEYRANPSMPIPFPED